MSNYAIIPRLGVYYFAIQKKTKFVPLFKISRANGTSPEEFHKLIEQLEIKQKNDTTRRETKPRNTDSFGKVRATDNGISES
jgi:hypothetical protein